MHGPLRLTNALLANYMPKSQMSSGPYGPIFEECHTNASVIYLFFYLYSWTDLIVCNEADKFSEEDTDTETDDESDKEISGREKLLLPIQCPLVDSFVGDIKQNLTAANM